MANANAKTMATYPTSLEAGHHMWAKPAAIAGDEISRPPYVGEAGRVRGRRQNPATMRGRRRPLSVGEARQIRGPQLGGRCRPDISEVCFYILDQRGFLLLH